MTFTPTYYPVASVNDTQDMLTIAQYTNEITGGIMFPLILLSIWVLQFIGVVTSGQRASRAFVFASFTATVLSILLGLLALVEQKWVYLSLIALSLGAFWVKLARSQN